MCSQISCVHTIMLSLTTNRPVFLKLSKQSMFTYPTMSRATSILFYSIFLSSSSIPPPFHPSCNPDAIALNHLLLADSLSANCATLHVSH